MFRAVDAVLIVSVHDRFGVAVGVELVTELFQLRTEFEVVVDLAVEDDSRRAILVVNGLLAAFEVDDGEAAHREADGTVDVVSVFVRAAMTNRIAHAGQERFVNRLAVVSNQSNDATHIAPR